ncbi:hypothetical protein ACLQ3K_20910 [Tsukamurella sp. DT100]|uniref:hypothetical protein n=1 Tax=Tsukamurella sp. DT100 TaxID=3393415 RepID=UPI003CF796CF
MLNIMNPGHRSEVAATSAFALPLVALVLLSGFNGLSPDLVSKVRVDLVLIGLAVCALGGLGLLSLGRGAGILGSVAAVVLGLCDIGAMIAGASALSAISSGDVPGFAAGLGQVVAVALAGAGVAFVVHLATFTRPERGDGAPSREA